MEQLSLATLIADIPSLRGVFVTSMPECSLYQSWSSPSEQWDTEQAGKYFGDLVRSNTSALKSLGAAPENMVVTIESGDLLIVLRCVKRFAIGVLFHRNTPLGLVRLHVGKIVGRLESGLPDIQVKDASRAARAI
jgi:hypothetical protein